MKYNLRLFKIAKLAKEKGFTTHTVTTKFTNDYLLGGKNVIINEICILLWMSELQKWLRKNYDIHIEIKNYSNNLYYGLIIYDTAPYEYDDNLVKDDAENCKTYEKALEICLYKGIKLIK
jgi:hypothetical protein